MNSKNIVVVGASAGGFEALKTLIAGLPSDFAAPVFVVWHMSPDIRGVLPQVLNKYQKLVAAHAIDNEPIEDGRVYVAPPDRHLLIENRHVRVTRGPKENRFRPAVDPLFRSAAHHYGPNVIGIILSGGLDDGTSGLWTIKLRGGVAVVQEPGDAEVPSMPENAIREVAVDHVLPVADMPDLLVRLIKESRENRHEAVTDVDENEKAKTHTEIRIAAEDNALEKGVMNLGEPSPYACPDCHGVLFSIRDGKKLRRFRCHTGHAFSADVLLGAISENIEETLWDTIRGIDETIIMLNHMGDHFAEANQTNLAALYFKKANEAKEQNDILRQTVFTHEKLSNERIRYEAESIDTERELGATSSS